MSKLGTHLRELKVRALSPDKRIKALLRNNGVAIVSFADMSYYEQYHSVNAIAEQVSLLLTSAYQGLAGGRLDLVRKYSRLHVSEVPHWNAQIRRNHEEQDNIECFGMSDSGYVKVSTRGLREWNVRIRPEAFEYFTAFDLCAEINSAIAMVHHFHTHELYRVKSEQYGQVGPIDDVRPTK